MNHTTQQTKTGRVNDRAGTEKFIREHQDLSAPQIAAILQRSRTWVLKLAKGIGVKLPKKYVSPIRTRVSVILENNPDTPLRTLVKATGGGYDYVANLKSQWHAQREIKKQTRVRP